MRVAAILLALAVAFPAFAERGPSTPAEREKTVKLARQLETEPLGAQAQDARRWLTAFLIEVPDVTVALCPKFFGDYLSAKRGRSAEIVAQMLFSAAAFAFEKREQANDDAAKFLAGVEGALRAYEAIVKVEPKERHPALDALLARRAKGELAAFVSETTPQCHDE